RMMMQAGGCPVTFEEVMASEHGIALGPKTFGAFKQALQTPDKRVNMAPQRFMDALRVRLAEPVVREDAKAYPYQIIARRVLPMMNSFLAETVAADMRDKRSAVVEIAAADAARDGISDGDVVTVQSTVAEVAATVQVSPHVRSGVAVMAHGW